MFMPSMRGPSMTCSGAGYLPHVRASSASCHPPADGQHRSLKEQVYRVEARREKSRQNPLLRVDLDSSIGNKVEAPCQP